jgi:hypothetical protein
MIENDPSRKAAQAIVPHYVVTKTCAALLFSRQRVVYMTTAQPTEITALGDSDNIPYFLISSFTSSSSSGVAAAGRR